MKRIILCADDYGQNFAVSQAIINLFEKKCLTATSCLSSSSEWPSYASLLLPFKGQVDLGLHFNLTQGAPLSKAFIEQYGPHFPRLSSLMMRSQLHWLDKWVIAAEFEAQLERFSQYMGQLPDFLDGHQHIHQFPVIREVVLAGWERHLKSQGAYIRSTHQPILECRVMKRLIIEVTGANALKNALVDRQIPHNKSFAGVYDFASDVAYSALFPQFLDQISDYGLIMCHPGLESDDLRDGIATARFQEYQYFISEQFLNVVKARSVRLVRGQAIR